MPKTLFKNLVLISLSALCTSCGSLSQISHEAQPITQKLRWHWLGSTSYASHLRTSDPENYWFEVNDERAVIQADCNKVSAKAMTTHEGRLWISNFASTKVNCPAGGLGAMFTKQLSQTQITEQRGQVLRISLSQYGDSMFFGLDPTARFASYRCDGGESMAVIAQGKTAHMWLGDQYSQVGAEDGRGESAGSRVNEGGIEAAAANCRKQTGPSN
jgi:heat shock protein HslJ